MAALDYYLDRIRECKPGDNEAVDVWLKIGIDDNGISMSDYISMIDLAHEIAPNPPKS